MSRRGNCWDNAVIESFHSNIKSEEFQFVKHNSLPLQEVISRVNVYIKHYNEERIQEKLGYQSPLEFRGGWQPKKVFIVVSNRYVSLAFHDFFVFCFKKSSF